MPDYQKMYYIVCDGANRALDVLPGRAAEAAQILQKALDEAEEKYIETSGDDGK